MKKIFLTAFLGIISIKAFSQKDFSPRYSHKGDKIAFYSYRNNGEPEIFVIDTNGKNLKQITPADGNWAIEPRWSLDDSALGFSMGENMGKLKVTTFHLKSKKMNHLPMNDIKFTQFMGGWTSDGIQFAQKEEGGLKFYSFNPAKKKTKKIQINQFKKYFVTSSKKAKYRIISVSDEDQKGLWIQHKDGSLKKISEIQGNNITFSKNGKLIVFEATIDKNTDIYSLHIDGTNLKRLTSNPANDYMPSIDPKGKFVVFSSSRSGKSFFLYKKNLKTGEITQLTGNDK